MIAAIYAHVTPTKQRERLAEYLQWGIRPQEEPTMEVSRVILRTAAVVVFLATLGVAPVPMTLLGLARWCASTLLASWDHGAKYGIDGPALIEEGGNGCSNYWTSPERTRRWNSS
jgi:hypothetical protein